MVRKIETLMLQVCSDCQFDCTNCVTNIARKKAPDYHMTIQQVQNIVDANKESGYFINNIWLNGFGEPLLWKELNNGLKILSESETIGKILIRSNGLGFDNIKDESFKYIDNISISEYEDNKEYIRELVKKHPQKIGRVFDKTNTFVQLTGNSAAIPCECMCPGPMIVGDHVVTMCGPVIFGPDTTVRLKRSGMLTNDDVRNLTYENMVEYIEKIVGPEGIDVVKPGYLDTSPLNNKRNLEACKYCWGNKNFINEGKAKRISSKS